MRREIRAPELGSYQTCFFRDGATTFKLRRLNHRFRRAYQSHLFVSRQHAEKTTVSVQVVLVHKSQHLAKKFRAPRIIWTSGKGHYRGRLALLFKQSQRSQHEQMILMLPELIADQKKLFRQRKTAAHFPGILLQIFRLEQRREPAHVKLWLDLWIGLERVICRRLADTHDAGSVRCNAAPLFFTLLNLLRSEEIGKVAKLEIGIGD